MTSIARLPRRIPGFRLIWWPLALSMALLAFALAGVLKLRILDFDGSRPLVAVIVSGGMILLLSVLPSSSTDDEVYP